MRLEQGEREEADRAMETPWLRRPSELALNLRAAVLQLGDPRTPGCTGRMIPPPSQGLLRLKLNFGFSDTSTKFEQDRRSCSTHFHWHVSHMKARDLVCFVHH